MIDIELKSGQSGYDVIEEYVQRYWEHSIKEPSIISFGTSYDGKKYNQYKEIVHPSDWFGVEFLNDWWEGEKFIKLFGITSVSKLHICGGIYLK